MNTTTRALAGAMLLAACGGGSRDAALGTFNDSASYALGMNMAASLGPAKSDVQLEAFISGFDDFYNERALEFDETQGRQLLQVFIQQVQQREQADMAEQGDKNMAEGAAYLEQNGARSGVTTTASGLQFEVLEEGTGERPGENSTVSVNYRGTFVDGTEFDSSDRLGQPARFSINGVIAGWTEGLKLMRTGGRYRLVVPSDLGYGDAGYPPDIAPHATLIFEVELVEFEG